MLNLPTAILIAGLLIAAGFASLGYFAYKIMLAIVVAKFSDSATEAAMLHKALTKKGSPTKKLEKKVADMPDIDLDAFSENEEVMETLRKRQTTKAWNFEGRAPEPEEQEHDYVRTVQEPSPDPY